MKDFHADALSPGQVPMSEVDVVRLQTIGALTIDHILSVKIIGRTKLYDEISSGRLKAKKLGSKTIILTEIWINYLKSLPDYLTEEGQ